MLTILEEIVEKTRERIVEEKRKVSLAELKSRVADMNTDTGFPFEKALREDALSFICEVKKASPSKGTIAQAFPYVEIAEGYEKAGASAVSVLTEPFYFKGRNAYLKEIKERIGLPVLRKDFTVDEYMIYEAKTLKADAILLICAILTQEQLIHYLRLAKSLGLSALVEAHDKEEVQRAVGAGASIIGVNNRNLKDFSVNIHNAAGLRELVPKERLFVSESGIRTAKDIRLLREKGADAVLIGETLMRSGNLQKTLLELRAAAC